MPSLNEIVVGIVTSLIADIFVAVALEIYRFFKVKGTQSIAKVNLTPLHIVVLFILDLVIIVLVVAILGPGQISGPIGNIGAPTPSPSVTAGKTLVPVATKTLIIAASPMPPARQTAIIVSTETVAPTNEDTQVNTTKPPYGFGGIRGTNYMGSPVLLTINSGQYQINANQSFQIVLPIGKYSYSINVLDGHRASEHGEITIEADKWVFWNLH